MIDVHQPLIGFQLQNASDFLANLINVMCTKSLSLAWNFLANEPLGKRAVTNALQNRTELIAKMFIIKKIHCFVRPKFGGVADSSHHFAHALFVQNVGDLAEAEGHHPGLLTEWGKVTVTWWSHSIKGLHRNDFIMAARTDEVANTAEGRK